MTNAYDTLLIRMTYPYVPLLIHMTYPYVTLPIHMTSLHLTLLMTRISTPTIHSRDITNLFFIHTTHALDLSIYAITHLSVVTRLPTPTSHSCDTTHSYTQLTHTTHPYVTADTTLSYDSSTWHIEHDSSYNLFIRDIRLAAR